MTMKLSIKLMAAVAVISATLTSCGGNASDLCGGNASELFGDLPKIYLEYKEKSSDANGNANEQKLRSEYLDKMEAEVANLNGREFDIASTPELKVTSPFKIEYHGPGVHESDSFDLEFDVFCSAEAATDIIREAKEREKGSNGDLSVNIVGYDSNGAEVFDDKVGYIYCEYDGKNAIVKAGTSVKFSLWLDFRKNHAEDYPKAKELKLVVGED